MINLIFAKFLETSLNQAISSNTTALEQLKSLSGKIIRIELTDLILDFSLFPDEQGIVVLDQYKAESDVYITGMPLTLLKILLQPNVKLNNYLEEINIEGDISVAQQLLTILQNLNLNLEERLTTYIGNNSAYQINSFFQQFKKYTSKRLDKIKQQSINYLQQKTADLPKQEEIQVFSQAVNLLEHEVTQFEQRVKNLL
ncbi:MAG: SCP2 sterol-binding domain-containing protein [Thiomargarita sp.]|nr:SCP2 sterol-binding domain-containing protein [Thiomargarita sp.]